MSLTVSLTALECPTLLFTARLCVVAVVAQCLSVIDSLSAAVSDGNNMIDFKMYGGTTNDTSETVSLHHSAPLRIRKVVARTTTIRVSIGSPVTIHRTVKSGDAIALWSEYLSTKSAGARSGQSTGGTGALARTKALIAALRSHYKRLVTLQTVSLMAFIGALVYSAALWAAAFRGMLRPKWLFAYYTMALVVLGITSARTIGLVLMAGCEVIVTSWANAVIHSVFLRYIPLSMPSGGGIVRSSGATLDGRQSKYTAKETGGQTDFYV